MTEALGLEPFLLRAGLAGLGVAVAAGPLGCFVVWRRMAYFGDATAHSAILGVALGLAAGLPVPAAVAGAAILMGLAVSGAIGRGHAADTALGVAAHGALAAGLVAVALLPGRGVSLEAYLFGDILAVTWQDLAVIWAGAVAVSGLLAWRWSALLTATLSPDLAAAEGGRPGADRLLLILALALLVAAALKVVGALLITAMLIVPAAAARGLSASPEAMAVSAVAMGAAATGLGLWASMAEDLPAGPAIVVAAVALFLATTLLGRRMTG